MFFWPKEFVAYRGVIREDDRTGETKGERDRETKARRTHNHVLQVIKWTD